MRITSKQAKALELSFNSGIVRNMGKQEYKEYMQLLFNLSMTTVRAEEGDQFIADFINAALSSELPYKVEQIKTH